MIYFFDNNFSPRHAEILTLLGVQAKTLRDEFGAGIRDVDFLNRLHSTGWVPVTADRHILGRRPEREALRASGVTALFFEPFWLKPDIRAQVAWFTKRWPEIDQFVAGCAPGTLIRVSQRGRLDMINI
jgi:hypothetical protein